MADRADSQADRPEVGSAQPAARLRARQAVICGRWGREYAADVCGGEG